MSNLSAISWWKQITRWWWCLLITNQYDSLDI